MEYKIVLSCEHATNHVPKEFSYLFTPKGRGALTSHRGYDIGAAKICRYVGEYFKAKPTYTEITRLLIDCNRTLGNKTIFSEFTEALTLEEKQILIKKYYDPYRHKIKNSVETTIKQRHAALHLSMHSFTPVLNHQKRKNDIGILYDPHRADEKNFATDLIDYLTQASSLRVWRNYPYRGTSDGLTTTLRKTFKQYVGVEIEVNQAIAASLSAKNKKLLCEAIEYAKRNLETN